MPKMQCRPKMVHYIIASLQLFQRGGEQPDIVFITLLHPSYGAMWDPTAAAGGGGSYSKTFCN